MQINDVHSVVSEVLKERALDHRSCYTSVFARPPDGGLVVECSDHAVGDALRRRMTDRLGDDARAISYRLLPNGDTLPELFVTATSVADVRREATHTAELLTQVIYGDAMTPIKQEGDWYLVRLRDGYLGWVRSWHVKPFTRAAVDRFGSAARWRVTANIIQIFEAPDEMSHPVGDAVVGTWIVASACGKRGWRRIVLADGREGFARSRGVGPPAAKRVSRQGLAATGMRFLGIPYLWGGTTPKGFDCSGLMQRIYDIHGVSIPRDSDQQSRYGAAKRVGSWESLNTGDLLFFGKQEDHITHVAMYLANGLFLHAYGQVRVSALDPTHGLFEPRLTEEWRVTKDPLSL